MTRRLLRILSPFLLLLCGAPPGALESAAAACTLTTAYTVRDHLGRNYPVLASNRLKYNGKEQQDFASLSLPYLDYGARLYNPAILRWNARDPKQEKNSYICNSITRKEWKTVWNCSNCRGC